MYKGNLCDVPNILVGHAQDERGMTGVTALLALSGAVAGVDVRGAAPGTRETDLLKSENTVEKIHGIALCGGSAFGLDAAGGVMTALEERGIGFEAGAFKVPIVCAAVIFDLGEGEPGIRPSARMGYEAAVRAGVSPAQGSVGAGKGATVGKLVPGTTRAKGGLGMASMRLPGGGTIAAMMVVNAAGDVVDPNTGELIACGTLGGRPVKAFDALIAAGEANEIPGQNTTIGVIATDVALTKAQANRLAAVAHDGLARSILPVHTVSDGDTIFALSTGSKICHPMALHACAVEVVARAVVNAVSREEEMEGAE
ncbi:MAG: P1 family peptidase [Christensenellaceae bacterium]|jgi:L-aminopeptidase/D-esterase-like protein|nr:P1 family peptidase [Christensenellaceae bacterium]